MEKGYRSPEDNTPKEKSAPKMQKFCPQTSLYWGNVPLYTINFILLPIDSQLKVIHQIKIMERIIRQTLSKPIKLKPL